MESIKSIVFQTSIIYATSTILETLTQVMSQPLGIRPTELSSLSSGTMPSISKTSENSISNIVQSSMVYETSTVLIVSTALVTSIV